MAVSEQGNLWHGRRLLGWQGRLTQASGKKVVLYPKSHLYSKQGRDRIQFMNKNDYAVCCGESDGKEIASRCVRELMQ